MPELPYPPSQSGQRTPTIEGLLAQLLPLSHAKAITPEDGVLLAHPTRVIDVTVDGNVSLIMRGDIEAVVIPFKAGQPQVRSVKVINDTGTTATGIIASW